MLETLSTCKLNSINDNLQRMAIIAKKNGYHRKCAKLMEYRNNVSDVLLDRLMEDFNG